MTRLNGVHRIASLLSILLLFHLNFVSSDLACARHGGSHAATAHASHESHGHPQGSHSEQRGDCDNPVSPDCCAGQASCAPAVDVSATMMFSEPAHATYVIPPGTDTAALPRSTAPETPPPRA